MLSVEVRCGKYLPTPWGITPDMREDKITQHEADLQNACSAGR